MKNKIEKRSFVFAADEERKMVGHAALFGEIADIGGYFREQIEPGAFKKSIKSDDVRALFNHDDNFVLGRNTAGTLKLSEDDMGLKVSIDPPDTQWARDLSVSMERGDISQMSFAFQVVEEEWVRGEEKDLDLRKIKRVRLFDVSPVTYPAYEGTDIALRSRDNWKEEIEKQEEEENQPPPEEPVRDDTARQRQALNRR